MRGYTVSEPGKGVEGWKLGDLKDPRPGPREILLRPRAWSLNYRDLMVAKGTYGGKIRAGLVPLSDAAGTIEAVGEGVTEWKAGDRVMSSFFQTWTAGAIQPEHHRYALGGSTDGTLADAVVLKATGVVAMPESLSFVEAATLPCAGLTAWNALFETTNPLKPGDTVLTLGTGGVSTFALLFAKAAGLRVVSTSSSDEKLARLRKLGADLTVNYRTHEKWDEEVWRLTDKKGVDHVVEVGGAGTLTRSMNSTRHGGTVSVIGVLTGTASEVNPAPILQRSLRVQGIYVGSVAMFRAMNQAIERFRLKPVIDEVFSFSEAKRALAKMEGAGHFGKIVIRAD